MKSCCWVYKRTPQPGGEAIYTVGHHGQDGAWLPEQDYLSEAEALNRIIELNGGQSGERPSSISRLDYFAGLAMQALIPIYLNYSQAEMVKEAYSNARAMIAESERPINTI